MKKKSEKMCKFKSCHFVIKLCFRYQIPSCKYVQCVYIKYTKYKYQNVPERNMEGVEFLIDKHFLACLMKKYKYTNTNPKFLSGSEILF